jgi:DnaK suppressor protein
LISALSVPAYFMATKKRAGGRRRPKAATEDVLGPARPPQRISRKWRTHHQRLIAARDHLLKRQAGLTKQALELQPTFSTHMADAGTDSYDRDFALGMASSEQEALYEIEQALKRIHDRTYGICELSGKPIDPARLEAIPWTRFSAAAEKTLEKDGSVKRSRLGPRETVARTEATVKEEEAA